MITRRTLLDKAALLAVAGGAAWLLREYVLWPAPTAAFVGTGRSSGWIPISDALPIVCIDVLLNGRRTMAVIDSGAQRSALDRAFAARIGLEASIAAPQIAFGVSGPAQVGGTAKLELDIGDLRLTKLHVALLDLPLFGVVDGERIPLILGQDVLRTVALDLDLPRRRLALGERAPRAAAPREGSLPARRIGRELFVQVELEGRPLEVAIDTGASAALSLSAALAEEAGLLSPGREVRWTPGMNFGGAALNREVIADSLSFAGRTIRSVPIQIYDRRPVGMLPPGLLGVAALDHARFLIDLADEQVVVLQGSAGLVRA